MGWLTRANQVRARCGILHPSVGATDSATSLPMFIGHYALGFAGRAALRDSRSPSLGSWFLAVQWLDLVWPIFVLSGLEQVAAQRHTNPFLRTVFVSYPWSHSLAMVVAWGALIGILYWRHTRRAFAAASLAAAVVSHWCLDVIVHIPDLPLAPGGTEKFGLGLWRNVPATLAIEGLLFLLAIIWYVRRTRPRDPVGRWSLGALIVSLLGIYGLSLMGGPPPDTGATIAAPALSLWLFVPWGIWIDRHRTTSA